jgi:hypothetical protein
LHTTSNALLFLILAALATQDSRVDQGSHRRGSRRRRRAPRGQLEPAGGAPTPALEEAQTAE